MNEPRLTSGDGVQMKESSMTRRSLRSTAPLGQALLGTAMLLLAACSGGNAEQQMPPAEVGVITVVPTEVVNLAELPGRVAAVRTAEVRARVDGIVERRLYTEGSDVGRGTPLFRIDSRPLRASLDVQLAALRRAQAEAVNAQRVVSRYRPLVAQDAISKQ